MRVSYRWLQELIPRFDRDPQEVADALSAIGLAVDGIEDHGRALRSVTLAEVVSVAPHPARAQLQLVTLKNWAQTVPPPSMSMPPKSVKGALPPDTTTVVCGARNVPPPGHLVAYAGEGTKLPGVDFVLAPRDIGGVVSAGMLCSEAELGLAAESDGILTWKPGEEEPGTRLIDAIPEVREVIFELDITPNRPDALGHVGVARDLAAFFEMEFHVPRQAVPLATAGAAVDREVTVLNQAPERCRRYGVGVIRGVEVGPSPAAMRYRLHRLGVRPISNVVDATNWLMLEWGQPLHAFDLAKVRGRKIVIRSALAGERMTTLDGVARELVADDLVICDGEGPTALAGVMGGAVSEISATTKDVLIECAYFEPRGVRRTARRQGLHSESSHRFERGTDHGATELVLERALGLVAQLGGGAAAPGTVRADGAPIEIPAIELRSDRMDKLLGVDVPFREATRLLARLGLQVEFVSDAGRGGSVARVRGASHRPDVTIEADLIEEVARIRGLDNIPTELPAIPPQTPRETGLLERKARQVGVELGLSEALTYAMVSPADLRAVGAPEAVVTLKNPLSEERSVLRTSLLPGLLEALRRSRRRGEPRVRLFTVGSVFLPEATPHKPSTARPRQPEDQGLLPYERLSFAAVLAGPRDEYLVSSPAPLDAYDVKGVAVEFVERMTARQAVVQNAPRGENGHFHPRSAGMVFIEGRLVARFGALHPDVVQALDLDGECFVIEVRLEELEQLGARTPRFKPLPKLPPVTRDVSLLVQETVPAARVADLLAEAGKPLCESVGVVAEFRGGNVPLGHRSLTFRALYRDPVAQAGKDGGRSLTDKEIDELEAKVLARAAAELGATLRS